MKKLMTLAIAALIVTLVVSAMAAGPAFAVCAPGGPVEANDQAQGCFGTAQGIANDKSNRNADRGLQTAFMHNTQP